MEKKPFTVSAVLKSKTGPCCISCDLEAHTQLSEAEINIRPKHGLASVSGCSFVWLKALFFSVIVLSDGAENMYYFTALALTLNEPEDGVAPTDSRRRPDQRLMEEGRWDEANAEKQRLEEKQRSARREREREAASQRTSSQSEEG